MRKIKFILMIALGFMLSVQTSAQSKKGGEYMLDIMVQRMAKKINLTDAQATDVKAAIIAYRADQTRSSEMSEAEKKTIKTGLTESIEGIMTEAQMPAFTTWKAKYIGN